MEPMEEFEKQSLTTHLAELRSCLLISLVAVGVGFSISYYFVQDIGYWFFKPLFEALPKESSLIFTSYQEAFFFI
ncbi:MAG: twin-arginine translocase subunit TatC [Proteobacteria bacterium]|nr:twin-arginine translocase subunit TatC [Pseudomonadota bacterium]MBU1715800.1 twin-arginine translocase subunit TatC [Pseudomonadota bacterium]